MKREHSDPPATLLGQCHLKLDSIQVCRGSTHALQERQPALVVVNVAELRLHRDIRQVRIAKQISDYMEGLRSRAPIEIK